MHTAGINQGPPNKKPKAPMQKPLESNDQIRIRISAQRRQLPRQTAAAAAAAAGHNLLQLPEFSKATRIAAYLAINGEIGTELVIRTAWQLSKKVYLPVLQPAGALLFAPYEPDSQMRNNRYRIPEPEITVSNSLLTAADLDLLIVPLVAFDHYCQRIGMGAGYYDRTLAGHGSNKPVRIGLAYSLQQVAVIRAQTWDIPMHKIVTEDKVFVRPDK
jgi:5-formyltetrahydrofolate cyclo-ligase